MTFEAQTPTGGPSVPIGTVIPFEKSRTGTDTIPSNFVECNGQTLSDSESPLDGQTMPDFNNKNEFPRGNTSSGAEGGADTVSLSVSELPSHNHNFEVQGASAEGRNFNAGAFEQFDTGTVNTQATGSNGTHENRPPFRDEVYIIRVK